MFGNTTTSKPNDKWALKPTEKETSDEKDPLAPEKENTFTDTLKKFGESTSIKGIPKVLKAKRIILKVSLL